MFREGNRRVHGHKPGIIDIRRHRMDHSIMSHQDALPIDIKPQSEHVSSLDLESDREGHCPLIDDDDAV